MSRFHPSTSAIEQALEQIRSVERRTEYVSAQRHAEDIDHLRRHTDPYAHSRDELSGTTAIPRATETIVQQHRPGPYGATGLPEVYDPYSTQTALDRARALDPYSPRAAYGPEATLATDTLGSFEHVQGLPSYADAELDALRRAAEAAGLSPRGADAYARDMLKRHGSYAFPDPTPLAFDHGGGSYEMVSAAQAHAPYRHDPTPRTSTSYPPLAAERSFADDLSATLPRRVSRRRGGGAPLPSPAPVAVDSVGELGEQLRQRRLAMGLSQQEFADMAGVGRRFLSELESGKESVELGRVIRVCRAAGLSLRIG